MRQIGLKCRSFFYASFVCTVVSSSFALFFTRLFFVRLFLRHFSLRLTKRCTLVGWQKQNNTISNKGWHFYDQTFLKTSTIVEPCSSTRPRHGANSIHPTIDLLQPMMCILYRLSAKTKGRSPYRSRASSRKGLSNDACAGRRLLSPGNDTEPISLRNRGVVVESVFHLMVSPKQTIRYVQAYFRFCVASNDSSSCLTIVFALVSARHNSVS